MVFQIISIINNLIASGINFGCLRVTLKSGLETWHHDFDPPEEDRPPGLVVRRPGRRKTWWRKRLLRIVCHHSLDHFADPPKYSVSSVLLHFWCFEKKPSLLLSPLRDQYLHAHKYVYRPCISISAKWKNRIISICLINTKIKYFTILLYLVQFCLHSFYFVIYQIIN